ncbi:MAG: glycosyltransferase family 2 protein [Eggerthellaceae bacterium]|jgi:glycosyltransferase involved in cell wall biosynthesis|nr:glycosyltransferase family 2 protein [Eggerthellaceae bacterium]MDR2716199.1 glycosyltransferase family 2 protein [Coriobacteriaceae bacterium]
MNPVIVIPTYVSVRRSREGGNVLTTYDHATPLTQAGELPRCLESLQQVVDIGPIVILVVSEPSIEVQAAEKVQKIASKFPKLGIVVIGAPELNLIQQRMEQLGLGRQQAEIGLSSYGAIRNLGLLVTSTLGFDAVVFIDDDEVIDDPEFLHNAMYGLGKLTKKGIPILAKSGFFFNTQGTYLSASQDKWYNRLWQQGRAFNKWMAKAMRGPRLSRSNYVCGGCFVLHKEAFKRLSFDPWITRGEDLDYMLNLRMYGSDMWFDNQWSLLHRPPASTSEGTRFRQDIYRWLYEFRKLEYSRTQIDLLQVKAASLEPYPGPFLEPGIMNRIRMTAFMRSLARPDKSAYRKAAKAATGEAATYAQRNCSRYFEFQFVWPEIMARMEHDTMLTTALIQSVSQRQVMINLGTGGIDPGSTSEIRLNIAE